MANELWWLLLLVTNFAAILFIYRFMGRIGILIWIPIATIIANIQVLKTIELFGVTATLGNIVYATSFLVTDILSENYGKKSARSAVLIGFFSLITATVVMNIALGFLPSPEDFAQESLVTLFSILPRITLASLAAYGISQIHDIWAYQFWRQKLPASRYIWVRNNASTMVSQLIDTLIFNTIAFAGVFPWDIWWEINLTTYLLKWLVAGLDTPLVYIAARWFSRGKIRELETRLD
ncbi:queuosine precursor transporter [Spirochaeta lutea]|uniref:Probable queuosine precursor transporter n=1 Tax=Spirochaeta lutea TaxID=1480694 RepID=A0A098R0S7_9SPIO|nr:queuosine precursor transporter [Spirochaeta lutea]KGE73770.1 membrane protein [Spirochaeta lutea]